ncbi:MAG: hypothetical protein IKP92_09205 [Lachnospiraceae bacterium]|nr:hypothetical protein [Lachnospiraceae bacterium]
MPKSITEQYTLEQFIEKAKDNGWILNNADEKKMEKLYDMGTYFPRINSALKKVAENNIWYKPDRESALYSVFNELQNESFSNTQFRKAYDEYKSMEHSGLNITQKQIDEVYKNRFGQDRPLSEDEKNELEAQKRAEEWKIQQEKLKKEKEERERLAKIEKEKRESERKARLEEENKKRIIEENKLKEYEKKAPDNEKAFLEKYNISQEEFLEKVQDLGWNMVRFGSGDTTGFKNLYKITVSSGDPDLLELFNKVLKTPVEDPAAREAMAKEIKAVEEKVLAKDYLPEDYRHNLQSNLTYYLKPVLSEQEVKYARQHKAEREQRKAEQLRHDKELEGFLKQTLENGWSKEEAKNLKGIFDACWSSLKNENSAVAPHFKKAFETKINSEYPAISKNGILTELKNAIVKDQNIPSKTSTALNKACEPLLNNLRKPVKEEKKKQKEIQEKLLEEQKKAKAAEAKKAFNEMKASLAKEPEAINNPKVGAKTTKADDTIENNGVIKKIQGTTLSQNDPLSVDEMRRQAKELYDTIKAVDFNLWGQGSTEFDEMLDSVEELHLFAQQADFKTENGLLNAGVVATFYDKMEACSWHMNTYIARKQGQFEENPNRVSEGRRQKHEQPRVNAALTALEKTKRYHAYGKNALVERLRSDFREKMRKKLVAEEKLRNKTVLKEVDYNNLNENDKANAITQKQYATSLGRSLVLLQNLNGSLWNPKEGEDFNEGLVAFTKRVADYADMEKIDEIDLDDNYSRKLRTTVKKAYNKFKGDVSKDNGKKTEGGVKVTTNELLQMYKADNPGMKYKKNMVNLNPEGRAAEAKQKVTQLKSRMLSENMKNQIGFVEPQAAPVPQVNH